MAKKGGWLSPSAYNQTGKEDSPEQKDPYFSLHEVIADHLSSEGADMEGSVNSRSGEGIMGHEANGELKYPSKK